jgi:TolB-like protein
VIKLRKALGDSSRKPRFVETVPKRGYRLIAPVQTELSDGQDADATPDAAGSRPGIVVLPFANLSPDAEQAYFAHGLAEDIITALSRVRTFAVISRGTSFQLGHLCDDPAAAGREVGVRYVLAGGVRRSNERLRVTAQLVDASSGEQVWAERFDRGAEDVFAVQDEITELVVGALEPELGFVERRRIRLALPESLDAWGHYQQGLAYMYQRTVEGDALAEPEFRRAAALDPTFAAPLAALSYTLTQTIYQSPSDEIFFARSSEARDIAEQAVALEPGSAMAYCALGMAFVNLKQCERAIEASRQAATLNPSSATCARVLGYAYLHSGDPDAAIPQFERALTLSPRDPETTSFYHGIAMSHCAKGDFEQALAWVERAILAPNPIPWCFVTRAGVLGCLDRIEEATLALELVRTKKPALTLALYEHECERFSRSTWFTRCGEGLRRAGFE